MVHVLPQLEERHQDYPSVRGQAALPGGELKSLNWSVTLSFQLTERLSASRYERRSSSSIRGDFLCRPT